MGVRKIATLLGKAIHVRSFDIGVSSKKADPVIQVVDADHQDVGRAGVLLMGPLNGRGG